MSDLIRFDYEGQPITFEFSDGSRMVNATEMIKPFPEKRMNNFLRSQQTKDFIAELETRNAKKRIGQNEPYSEVLRIVKGGEPGLQGTWMSEQLALKFAGWLSPRFEVWVYDRILELITTGETSLNVQPGGFAQTLRLLAEQWEKQDKINQGVRVELDTAANRLDELEAKITSTDENYYTIAGYCSLNGIACPLDKAKAWGKAATALSRQRQLSTGTAHDERYGKVRTYHKDILEEVIGG